MDGIAVTARVEAIRLRVAEAAERGGRSADAVLLIAVSKGVSVAAISEAVSAGVADIGENRVHEARDKRAQIDTDLRWHLLGHLQTNKARLAADLFDVVHSLDSERVARALATSREGGPSPITGLVEVDFSDISGRTGVAESEAEQLVRRCSGMTGIQVAGLMTIAPPGNVDGARDCFRRLRHLRDRLQAIVGVSLPELSMGMSDDFEVAIEEGATMVRVGRALFGER